ncbi:PREDICTED: taste receptor type 2 member 16 [Propithecus coquereli]|uniref:taste receptor type 2 member 16 n=1 Tax=Propithecus coquereli TaxID=379532 RepID=UPI00063F0D10|nr:PREDICTED: taste receptor type 2 member 16 [Propithecus coquereli]
MIPLQLTIVLIVIYMLESLTIIVQNSLIVAVLCREWLQVKRLSPLDMILTSLGICRFCLQWLSILSNFFRYFNLKYVFWYLSIIWEFSNILIFWLTSLLAVFYCVKVSSFTNPIFLWLRWRISRLVPWLLLGSLMISCVTIIPSTLSKFTQIQLNTMEHLPRNSTVIVRLAMFQQYLINAHKLVAVGIPFLVFLASTTLLVASLIQHVWQMQHRNTGHGNSCMKAHSTALRSLAILFIFFTSYFLTIVISLTHKLLVQESLFWVWEPVIYAVVTIHSTSLMSSSPTLKKALKVKCWGLDAA